MIFTLLQTLDDDGNPDNGINILPKVVEELKTVQASLPTTHEDIVALFEIIKNVESYEGAVKTVEEAETHVIKTQTGVTKRLLAGKTFYVVDSELDIVKIVFNSDATAMDWTQIAGGDNQGTGTVTIDGNTVTLSSEGSTDELITIKEATDKYLLISNTGGTDVKVYVALEDAKAALSVGIKYFLAGKTFYLPHPATIEEIVFNSDVTSMTWREVEGGQDSGVFAVIINENSLIIDGGKYIFKEQTDKYIEFIPEGLRYAHRLYFTLEDARQRN